MSNILKMQSRGTITIPKEIRKSLNLDDGDFFDVSLKNGKIIIEPVKVIDKGLQKKVLQYLKIKKNRKK